MLKWPWGAVVPEVKIGSKKVSLDNEPKALRRAAVGPGLVSRAY